MREDNRSISQFNAGSIRGKPSRLRWLFPFFLIGLSTLIAGVFLLMRIVGLVQIQQGFLLLIFSVSLLSSIAFGTLLFARHQRLLLLSRNQQNWFTLALILPVFVGMLATLPLQGLTLSGGLIPCTLYFLAFILVLELLGRERSKYSETYHIDEGHDEESEIVMNDDEELLKLRPMNSGCESVISEETPEIETENNEALFESLIEASDSFCEAEDESKENYSQWMNRVADPDGFEVIEGGSLVQFSVNQKVHVVHIGLFPPLEGDLDVVCELENGAETRVRVLEIRGYGVSVEVNRASDLASKFETNLYYRITNRINREEVA